MTLNPKARLVFCDPAARYDVYVVARDFRPPPSATTAAAGSGGDVGAPRTLELGVMQDRPTRMLLVTPEAAASLVSLVPSIGVLDPPFSPGIASYRLRVPDMGGDGGGAGAPTVTFMAAAADAHWVVKVNGTEVSPGAASGAFTTGAWAVTVAVTVAPPGQQPAGVTGAANDTFLPATVTAAATYLIRVVHASPAAAAAAADPSLAYLHVALDDGGSFNSTRLGGAAWPECTTGCRPMGSAAPCVGGPGCVLDPAQRRYRLVASPRVALATVTAIVKVPGATVHLFDGPPEITQGVLMSATVSSTSTSASAIEGASPPAVFATVALERVEAKAPFLGAAAIYLRVTSLDGAQLWFYTVAGFKGHGAEAPGMRVCEINSGLSVWPKL